MTRLGEVGREAAADLLASFRDPCQFPSHDKLLPATGVTVQAQTRGRWPLCVLEVRRSRIKAAWGQSSAGARCNHDLDLGTIRGVKHLDETALAPYSAIIIGTVVDRLGLEPTTY